MVETYLKATKREEGPASPEEALRRADQAARFVDEPYWARMCDMLLGTQKAEFEEMLAGNERLDLSRAAVVTARKVMRMPFVDIEQGQKAVRVSERFRALNGPQPQRRAL